MDAEQVVGQSQPQIGQDATALMGSAGAVPPVGADVSHLMGGNTPSDPTYLDRAVDWLPVAGGAIGGIVGNIPGALLGGGAGEAYKELINRARGKAAPTTSTEAATDIASSGAVQGAAQAVGAGIGAGMGKLAPWLMQSALKPTVSMLKEYGTTAPALVKTLLDQGVSVTEGGLAKLNSLFSATNDEIKAVIAKSPGTVNAFKVAGRLTDTARKAVNQVNPEADLQAISDAGQEFLNHPKFANGPTMSVADAQAMKQGTYQQIGKKYGEVSSAGIEAQKSLARGLKEDIAAEVPEISALNAKDSALMAALDAVGRRVALSGNRDPIGFAWVAHNPTTFLAALIDKNPAIKSLVARGLYQSAGKVSKVAPALIQTAVHSLASEQPAAGGSD